MKEITATQKIFGTKEWAQYNENIISGCAHDCRYCYAKTMAVRFHRKSADTWKQETVDHGKVLKHFTKKKGRIMFPTTHDITPEHLDCNMKFLSNMLSPGNEVLIVSKPHYECIKAICNSFRHYQKNIMFRFTIGSAFDETLKFWEPNAPGFDERLASLIYAHKAGYQTSISCEPMLDDKVDVLIPKLLPFVTDAVWLGIGNQMTGRLRMNGHGDAATMQRWHELEGSQSNGYIRGLYDQLKDDPKIKWKESVKKIVGIEIPTVSGLDI
ncbi:MAG: hypothetical protein NTW71_13005 [Deltaproteobacteria bacterium]|nr:hypothetical protein [Deltaproteobacteria bacterium]